MTRMNVKKIILRSIPLIGLAVFFSLIVYGYHLGIFRSANSLQTFIHQFGNRAVLVFVFLQLVQVIVPILPGGISTVVGMLMFGNIWGLVYSYIGLVLGEIITFFLVRYYGTAFVQLILSEKKFQKFQQQLANQNKNIKKLLAGTLLIPFAPDDLACLIAGLSGISFADFIKIVLLLKPWSIGIYGYLLMFLFHQSQVL